MQEAAATVLSASLKDALEAFKKGEHSLKAISEMVKEKISKEPLSNIEYVECYGLPGLYPLENEIKAPSLLALAVRFGNTRLIDNIILE